MTSRPDIRTAARIVLSAVFLGAGVLHLMVPGPFVRITPQWVSDPALVVALTGLAELLGAAGLIIPRLRVFAGWALALYCVGVYPANIQHAMDGLNSGTGLVWAYHGPRLLFQPVIIWWCLWASTAIDWPFKRSQAAARVPPISMERI
ncbi:DoxX family membrane protein [Brevundimonas intermedia]|uniref:DoxX family membrane protein n=1 Tax=Brevundimonas intermedia TaxID=74315 RepID=A0A4Y9RZY6_9CAUL|nr:DoxX family protein [Brevundimonas intermedia]TFW14473.1 DoxX family membrane protein [Brevundimonas intermedia]